MTRRGQVPEEATEEPRILSPAEQGARAWKRLERADKILDAEQALSLGDPDSPLRMPGELSPRPRHRDRAPAAERDDAEDEDDETP